MRAAALIVSALLALLSLEAGACAPTRHYSAKAHFAKLHPCPSTGLPKPSCPGFVIDHVKARACGGPDTPANMQWQTIADAKAKDKWERKECGK